jgi:hypothetical protein
MSCAILYADLKNPLGANPDILFLLANTIYSWYDYHITPKKTLIDGVLVCNSNGFLD